MNHPVGKQTGILLTVLLCGALIGVALRSREPQSADLTRIARPLGEWQSEVQIGRAEGWLYSQTQLIYHRIPPYRVGFYERDLQTGQENLLSALTETLGQYRSVSAVSPDGSRVLAWDANTKHSLLADVSTGKIQADFSQPGTYYFLPDGRNIAQWNLATKQLSCWQDGQWRTPRSVATFNTVTADTRVVGADKDGLLVLDFPRSLWFSTNIRCLRLPFQGGTPQEVFRTSIPNPWEGSVTLPRLVILSPNQKQIAFTVQRLYTSRLPNWVPPVLRNLTLAPRRNQSILELWTIPVQNAKPRKIGELVSGMRIGEDAYSLWNLAFAPDSRVLYFQTSFWRRENSYSFNRRSRNYCLPLTPEGMR